MANTSIQAAFERMWQHVVAKLGNKADVNHTHSDATQSASGFLSAEDKTQLDNGGIPIVAAASSDGVTYTATVDGITALTTGMKITIIPSTNSTNVSPTLNVNSLGAKYIRMPVAYNSSATATGAIASWIIKSKPITLEYDGTYWKTISMPRPSALYLHGTVPVSGGGTGVTSVTAGSYLVGNGTEAMVEKTPAEVLSDIGALPLAGGTMTGGISLTPAAGKELALSFYTTGGTYEHFTYFYGANSNSTTALGCYDNNGGGAVWSYNDQKKLLQLGGATVGLILTASSFGDTLPAAGTAGRIFFQKA